MTAAICAACDEHEHDTCLRLLRPDSCGCTCPPDPALEQPPIPPASLFIVCGFELPKAAAPPWAPSMYCGFHHLVAGDNAYYDAHQRRWFCQRCRRDSWRRSKRRIRAAAVANEGAG